MKLSVYILDSPFCMKRFLYLNSFFWWSMHSPSSVVWKSACKKICQSCMNKITKEKSSTWTKWYNIVFSLHILMTHKLFGREEREKIAPHKHKQQQNKLRPGTKCNYGKARYHQFANQIYYTDDTQKIWCARGDDENAYCCWFVFSYILLVVCLISFRFGLFGEAYKAK